MRSGGGEFGNQDNESSFVSNPRLAVAPDEFYGWALFQFVMYLSSWKRDRKNEEKKVEDRSVEGKGKRNHVCVPVNG